MSKDCEYHKNKYKDVPEDEFCGQEGGEECKYTYPVDTPKRAIAAMSYARHAPDPSAIRRCARRHAEEKGWIDPETNMIKRDGEPPEVIEIDGRFYVIEKDENSDIVDIRPFN